MNKVKVGITGIGSVVGQAVIKSILHSNLHKMISMVGFDYFKDTIGSFWVEKSFLLPDCLKKEIAIEMWVDKIIEYIKLENIKFLLVSLDFELRLIAKYKELIESKTQCRVLISDMRVIEIADDKYLTYKFLKGGGLYYPKTLLLEELDREKIDFPCIVKPRFGSRSRDIFIVNNIRELKYRLGLVNQPIIQELIGSSHDEYTCGIIYLEDSIKGMIALRRELKDGNTLTAYFIKDIPGIIYDYLYRIATRLKPFGACNFQLRIDGQNIPKVFEINARHSGTTYIRALFGFNEVEYILAYFLGYKVENFKLKEGVVKRYYEEMFIKSEKLKIIR